MPKKKQALPTPKAKLYTEDAALLVPIFQKEPFITCLLYTSDAADEL